MAKTIALGITAALAATALAGGGANPGGTVGEVSPARTGKPQRIVSLNLCTDQLLMQMVDHDRIRALTSLARDTRSSGMAGQAMRIAETSGSAEQVIAMKPDLVLAGTFSTRETVSILRRLGYNVVEFEPETDFAGIIANIRKMAAATGEIERGEQMVAQIEQALADLPPPPAKRPVYANYYANGFTTGDGALVTQVANLAGFDTLGQKLGITGTRQVSLEQMLLSRPDVIDLGDTSEAPALATEIFRHPALQRLMREQQVISMPGKYTVCGTMQTLLALEAFTEARKAL